MVLVLTVKQAGRLLEVLQHLHSTFIKKKKENRYIIRCIHLYLGGSGIT
jgi:hypothetical protein